MIDLMIGVYVHVSPDTMGTQRGRGREEERRRGGVTGWYKKGRY